LADAARVARAALRDTLDAALAAPAAEHVLALDGPAEEWVPPGYRTIVQRGDGLGQRLAAAFDDVGGPALLIGMDTPQVTPALLSHGLRELDRSDAVLGPALDGGYWAIGLRAANAGLFDGVPMSRADTFERQLARLRSAGLAVGLLEPLRDVDRIDDAYAVARLAPRSRFACELAAVAA
jgi:glycosyltransferase A (GT-A) superfamily protein (DUF2064 family)